MPGQSSTSRAWSWYRLDDRAAFTIVDDAEVGRGELVLDLGAGEGALTRHLVTAGATVVAFELHPSRADRLRRLFTSQGVKVVRADVRDLRLPTRPFRVVANPPFRGVSAVLARLTSRHSRLVRADLVVPRSVAMAWHRRLQGPGTRFGVAEIRMLPRLGVPPTAADRLLRDRHRPPVMPNPQPRHLSPSPPRFLR